MSWLQFSGPLCPLSLLGFVAATLNGCGIGTEDPVAAPADDVEWITVQFDEVATVAEFPDLLRERAGRTAKLSAVVKLSPAVLAWMERLRPAEVDLESGDAAGWVHVGIFPNAESVSPQCESPLFATSVPNEFRFETTVEWPPSPGDFVATFAVMAKTQPTQRFPGVPGEVPVPSVNGLRLLEFEDIAVR